MSEDGVPFLLRGHANIFCTPATRLSFGTHSLFVGEVYRVNTDAARAELLYMNGEYLAATSLSPAGLAPSRARVSGSRLTPEGPIDLPPASGVFVTLKLDGQLRGCLGTTRRTTIEPEPKWPRPTRR